jgi:carotenoid 1,2-hydratase
VVGPRFDRAVTRGGYAWWYVDALSDDGRHGLTLIGMLGNVFSPWYARARAAAALAGAKADPLEHCTMNVALYGPRGATWALTERGARDVSRGPAHLTLGASHLRWERGELHIDLREQTSPFPSLAPGRIVGKVRVIPTVLHGAPQALDADGRHLWWAVAPHCRVEVELTEPALRWSGVGYHDANAGDAPLEDDFHGWDWSRADVDGRPVVIYDATARDGHRTRTRLARRYHPDGSAEVVEVPAERSLGRTRWGIPRSTRCDRGATAAVARSLEDAPFYARSVLSTSLLGAPVHAMHESVDLDRFASSWVRFLIPFRMRRGA